jgi:hypothetical protein
VPGSLLQAWHARPLGRRRPPFLTFVAPGPSGSALFQPSGSHHPLSLVGAPARGSGNSQTHRTGTRPYSRSRSSVRASVHRRGPTAWSPDHPARPFSGRSQAVLSAGLDRLGSPIHRSFCQSSRPQATGPRGLRDLRQLPQKVIDRQVRTDRAGRTRCRLRKMTPLIHEHLLPLLSLRLHLRFRNPSTCHSRSCIGTSFPKALSHCVSPIPLLRIHSFVCLHAKLVQTVCRNNFFCRKKIVST